jgi:hypothetical protein
MNAQHYLCSELVVLRINSRESFVNLEEIWQSGAVLDSEDPVEAPANVEIHCGETLLAGRTVKVEHYEFGWRVEVELSPLTPWTPEKFRPQHMLAARL